MGLPTKENVLEVLPAIYSILNTSSITLGLFGSYARGNFNKSSDIDIVFKETSPESNTLSLQDMTTIRKFIKSHFNKSVDIVDYWVARSEYESRDDGSFNGTLNSH